MIVTGNNEEEVLRLREELAIRFKMKNLGELSYFLGLEVTTCKGGLFVSQEQYVKKILKKFNMQRSLW